MAAAAVLPVKRFDRAKQRLQPQLGTGSRQALAAAMFADVLSSLRHSGAIETVVLVSGEPVVRDTAATEPGLVLIDDASEKGQSNATLAGLARVAAIGFERALLVPGDTPLVDPAEVDGLLANAPLRERDVVIVPDRHGTGTNALLLDPYCSFQPQFGPDSRARHEQGARRRGLTYAVEQVPSLALDVDTAEDVAELRNALEQHRGRAPRTQGVLRQMERSRGSSIPA